MIASLGIQNSEPKTYKSANQPAVYALTVESIETDCSGLGGESPDHENETFSWRKEREGVSWETIRQESDDWFDGVYYIIYFLTRPNFLPAPPPPTAGEASKRFPDSAGSEQKHSVHK